MFTLSPVGVPVAIAGTLFILLVSSRLLPDRQSGRPSSSVTPVHGGDGRRAREPDRRRHHRAGRPAPPAGLYLAAIERNGLRRVAVPSDEHLRGNDLLTFVGVVDSVVDLQRTRG
jgi:hypothetical protein